MALRWTTYLKSRLNCSIPGDYPFYFNHLRKSLPGDYCSDCQCFHRICEFDRWGHLPGQTYEADLWSLHNAGERHWRQRHLRLSGSQIPTWLDLNLEREKRADILLTPTHSKMINHHHQLFLHLHRHYNNHLAGKPSSSSAAWQSCSDGGHSGHIWWSFQGAGDGKL